MNTSIPELHNFHKHDMSRPNPIDTVCRTLVHRKLKHLNGALRIMDSWGDEIVGDRNGLYGAIRISDPTLYRRLVTSGSLGAAEGWMDQQWETDNLTDLVRLFVHNIALSDTLDNGLSGIAAFIATLRHRKKANNRVGSRNNIRAHYDLGNDLFSLFLDSTMTYSSAIFDSDHNSLESASINKLDRICRKLNLEKDDHLLEIGCGWGSLAIHAAEHYDARVTAVTISQSQLDFAKSRAERQGIGNRIDFQLRDYRDIKGQFKKIASIEMIEAVGHQYLPEFFERCGQLLDDDGCMVIQAITMPDQRYEKYRKNCDFIQKYIFPGSCVPSLDAMLSQVKVRSKMKLIHLEDIGAQYAETLHHWHARFSKSEKEAKTLGYSDRFIRLWHYYLSYCEAGFREHYLSDLQMVFANPGWNNDFTVEYPSVPCKR